VSSNRLIDLSELAALLAVSERSVRRLVACGELAPPVKVGRCARWFEADVQTYLDKIRRQRENVSGRYFKREGLA
jgi:excisionase family DNA binding protein